MASYPAIVEWDENAGAYGAVFPDLDIGAVGITLEEVLGNAKDTLQDYVTEMHKRGWPVSGPSRSEQVEVPEGYTLMLIPLTLPSNVAVIDAGASSPSKLFRNDRRGLPRLTVVAKDLRGSPNMA